MKRFFPVKPWREIAMPHADVLKGTFLQSEFAADITAVHSGKAAAEYQDAKALRGSMRSDLCRPRLVSVSSHGACRVHIASWTEIP
jgi:hypothetical protein